MRSALKINVLICSASVTGLAGLKPRD
jgi:hypothetical protein